MGWQQAVSAADEDQIRQVTSDSDEDDDQDDVRMDHDADDMENICFGLKCRGKGRRGYYRAGPALEGTPCGTNMVITGPWPRFISHSSCSDLPGGRLCQEHHQSRGEQLCLMVRVVSLLCVHQWLHHQVQGAQHQEQELHQAEPRHLRQRLSRALGEGGAL